MQPRRSRRNRLIRAMWSLLFVVAVGSGTLWLLRKPLLAHTLKSKFTKIKKETGISVVFDDLDVRFDGSLQIALKHLSLGKNEQGRKPFATAEKATFRLDLKSWILSLGSETNLSDLTVEEPEIFFDRISQHGQSVVGIDAPDIKPKGDDEALSHKRTEQQESKPSEQSRVHLSSFVVQNATLRLGPSSTQKLQHVNIRYEENNRQRAIHIDQQVEHGMRQIRGKVQLGPRTSVELVELDLQDFPAWTIGSHSFTSIEKLKVRWEASSKVPITNWPSILRGTGTVFLSSKEAILGKRTIRNIHLVAHGDGQSVQFDTLQGNVGTFEVSSTQSSWTWPKESAQKAAVNDVEADMNFRVKHDNLGQWLEERGVTQTIRKGHVDSSIHLQMPLSHLLSGKDLRAQVHTQVSNAEWSLRFSLREALLGKVAEWLNDKAPAPNNNLMSVLHVKKLSGYFTLQGGQLSSRNPLTINAKEADASLQGELVFSKSIKAHGTIWIEPSFLEKESAGWLAPTDSLPMDLEINGPMGDPQVNFSKNTKTMGVLFGAGIRGFVKKLL